MNELGTADAVDVAISELEQAAWALAALAHLGRAGLLAADVIDGRTDEDAAAAAVLVAVGLAVGDDSVTVVRPASGLLASWERFAPRHRHDATMSTMRQIAAAAGVTETSGAAGWAAADDATLLAQGRASATAGTLLATVVAPALTGLADRFLHGGWFLDVGTGVGELAVAFAETRPAARVVGIDVMPRAVELARRTVSAHRLDERVEIRLQPVEELVVDEAIDMAWVPAPFIPRHALVAGLRRIAPVLRPGGWVVVGAGRFDGSPLAVAVTRWQTLRAGGTPLTADDAHDLLTGAGFGSFLQLPTPPGAPALFAARREP
jgi:predicted O-methyltransferase YrrM